MAALQSLAAERVRLYEPTPNNSNNILLAQVARGEKATIEKVSRKVRKHTWHYMHLNAPLLQVLHFLATAAKDVGVAALESEH